MILGFGEIKLNDIKGWQYSPKIKIGKGGQGKVYVAKSKKYEGEYAIKVYKLKWIRNDAKRRKKELRINNEIRVFKSIIHKSIIRYIDSGYLKREDIFYIVMDKADTSLKYYVHDNDLTLEEKIDLFLQIIEGVRILHDHRIIHRDLKPANILIKCNTVKITDFGISFFLEDRNEPRVTSPWEIVGSRNWRSPQTELGRQDEPSIKEDFYSMGKILYFLLNNGKELYREHFDSREFFLPYIHKDPKYLVFEDFFIHTIAENHRDIYDNLDDFIKEFEKAWKEFKTFPIDREIEELIRLAHVFHMNRRYEEHKDLITKAYNMDRGNPYGQYYYGKLLYGENRQESLSCFYDVVNNAGFNDYLVLADIALLLFHNDDAEMCEILVQRSKILKERGILPKILSGLSEESKKYLKYSALGRP